MGKTYSISIKLGVLEKFQAPLNKMGSALNKLSAKVSVLTTKFRKMGGTFVSTGKKMATGITLPLIALGAVAINTTKKFDASMNKVAAVTQASGEEFKKLEKLAMEMGRTTQFSASQSAEAMTFLGMAGLDTEKIMAALPGTLQLAAAGGLDLASAADIATNVMTSMGLEVKDLAHVNDVLALAQAKSNTNISELAEALRPVAGTASTLGVSLEEVTAMLGKMADAGEKGGLSGTLLRNAMLSIVKPSKTVTREFAKLGINITDFVTKDGKIKNFSKLITTLSEKGATTGTIFKIFGERGARAILTLQKKGKNIDEFTEKLKNSEGTAKEMADIMMRGLPGAILRLSSAWEGLILKLTKGEAESFIEVFINKLTDLINTFSNLSDTTRTFIVTFAGILAVIGPTLVIIGKLIKLYNAFALVIGVVKAALLSQQMVTIANTVALVANKIALVANKIALIATAAAAKIAAVASAIFNAVLHGNPIAIIAAIIIGAAAAIIANWESVKEFFVDMMDIVGKVFDAVINPFGIGGKKEIVNTSKIAGKIGDSKSETDINLKVQAEPGTSVLTDKVSRKKGAARVKTQTSGYTGNIVPVAG